MIKRKTFSYSATDNFLSPVPVPDWLIFSYWNSILHQKKRKKRNENDKNTNFFDEKQQQQQEQQ